MTTATETHTPSRGCYQRGCRSDGCTRANYRYGKRLATEHVRGSAASTTSPRSALTSNSSSPTSGGRQRSAA
ncbi:hypothetical protein ACFQ51_52425 [Streptomyces kaempferi]